MKNKNIKILAIDTSCDETSVAVLEDRKVLANVLASQTELHKKWGGVVPMVARRAHQENIGKCYLEAMKRARLKIDDIDVVAATYGPGLAIDLEVGLQFAQKFAIENKKPFIPVNHMEGHLLSSLALNSKGHGVSESLDKKQLFPALGLLVSGKHTEIILAKDYGNYQKLGKTLDDAAGEAFDKVGRMLNFGYPGGPIVSEFAKKANHKESFELPVPMRSSGNLDFSFSGLKTACLYKINSLRESGRSDKEWANDFCWEFIECVVLSITEKLGEAINQNPGVKSLLVGGGVFNNETLARRVGRLARKHGLKYLLPEKKYRSDNAVMIDLAAYVHAAGSEVLIGKKAISKVDRVPRLSISD
ncbi:tRNA (adenosine(37)-N6)-threonylcarbamoyltransferase complex transferase subunit TsaD [Candidatus Nomurabacteria bacterium]|nr:tRNA (adenosine(37)-N6)-threonylcarbamoyltransferase complex transferase subunit TsaD [Candidatus Nomurabacteria bacterium]